jgi:hypothetical protein
MRSGGHERGRHPAVAFGRLPESQPLCGISGYPKWVETDENDTKAWNDTLSDGIIESTDRRCDQNRIYLGNVGKRDS